MSLSLEVKKFVNSEHVGDYVQIALSGAEPPQRARVSAKKAAKTPSPAEAQGDGTDPLQAAPAEEPLQPEMVKLHYLDQGSGEPLILVHSVGQSIYTWRELFARLSTDYRAVALDLPGHGYSDRPMTFGYTVEEQADAIAAFMDARGIRSAHFMAFSMGSAYVLQFARMYPARTGRIILLAPGGMAPEMPTAFKMLDSGILGGLAAALYGMRTVENVLGECYFDLAQTMKPEVVQEYYKTVSDRDARRALRMSVHNYDDADVIASLRQIQSPVLLMQGSEDKWRKDSEQTSLYHAALPNAGYAIVRNAGHLLHEEKAERVVAAVREFIPVLVPAE